MRDYQTATGIINAAGKVDIKRTVVSPRYYLSGAAFLVGFKGDRSLLVQIHQALKTPHWPPCKYPGKTNHSLLEIFRHT
ncbi:type I-E CRISPR-associated protein Cas5/CasD [Lelliottia sp. SL45]|uniref:type I-E CRISPR-associated protein Cas5/CasD n=1 Tax=Lelliottia sp. SL45 TaxID=2994665 RepID=UPI003FA3653C